MIRRFITPLLVCAMVLVPAVLITRTVMAAEVFKVCEQPEAAESAVCKGKQNPVNISEEGGLLERGVSIFSFIIGFTAVLIMIWGGMNYIMSNGDATKIARAKDTILFAAIGLLIAVVAQVIVRFILGRII